CAVVCRCGLAPARDRARAIAGASSPAAVYPFPEMSRGAPKDAPDRWCQLQRPQEVQQVLLVPFAEKVVVVDDAVGLRGPNFWLRPPSWRARRLRLWGWVPSHADAEQRVHRRARAADSRRSIAAPASHDS